MRLVFAGFGTVGQGLAELLIEQREALRARYGFEWTVTGISTGSHGCAADPNGLDLGAALSLIRAGGTIDSLGTGEPFAEHGSGDVLLEMTPTDLAHPEAATATIRAALARGLHVVSANKGPIARHLRSLEALADERGVRLLFEATVMAGTPILNLVRETLAGATLNEVRGILNGTTNFILSEMGAGRTFADALAEAQRRGWAEAVPDADVLGWDTLAKTVILANVVLGGDLAPEDIPCQGITGVTQEDIAIATAAGQCIKLIGRAWRDGSRVHATVGCERISLADPLAHAGGTTSAATLYSNPLGAVTVFGPGAGGRETGFAMLSDLLAIHRAGRSPAPLC